VVIVVALVLVAAAVAGGAWRALAVLPALLAIPAGRGKHATTRVCASLHHRRHHHHHPIIIIISHACPLEAEHSCVVAHRITQQSLDKML
jgi:hypothetical protein